MKSFLVFMLFISLIVNVVFIYEKTMIAPPMEGISSSSQQIDSTKLRLVAEKCGVSEAKVNEMSTDQLLTEITIKLNDTIRYYGVLLSNDEWDKVEKLLFGKNNIIKILKEQDSFIRKIQEKDILILK